MAGGLAALGTPAISLAQAASAAPGMAYDAIARKCGGEAGAKDAIDTGIRRTLQFSGGTSQFIDEARKERDHSTFEPKADWEIEGRSWGGRGGRGGGKGG